MSKKLLSDPDLFFIHIKKLIKLRHENPIVVDGNFELVENTGDNVLAFWRKLGDEEWLIVANLSGKKQDFNLDNDFRKVLISNYEKRDSLKNITLNPYEAFAVRE